MTNNYQIAPFLYDSFGEQVLLTNDAGRFIFLTENHFADFVKGQLPLEDSPLPELLNRGFAYAGAKQVYLDTWVPIVRQRKACHFSGTQLFILVLTTACNQRCVYCQASAGVQAHYMHWDIARMAIDMAYQSPAANITLEFQGGEPTLNDSVLRKSICYAQEKQEYEDKELALSLVTNLTQVNTEQMDWLLTRGVSICTSLDGSAVVYNKNRPMHDASDSYSRFLKGAQEYRKLCEKHNLPSTIQAIQTTTRYALQDPRDVVNAYRDWGIDSLYIRPLTPLGFAATRWSQIGYTPEEFLAYYCHLIRYLLELASQGISMRETTATLFLKRILTDDAVGHTEYRSPCGAGIGQMAIQYNGDVYPCDEARMLDGDGSRLFRMGSVKETYRELISSPVVHATCLASCIEGLPGCCDCVYQPFCAACPVVTYGVEQSLIPRRPTAFHCAISKGILQFLFSLIHDGDTETMNTLREWTLC